MKKSKNFETNAIRYQLDRTQYNEHSNPLYLTSSFVFNSAEEAKAIFAQEIPGYQYSRLANPNSDEFADKLCILEGTEDGIATATGMAAIFGSLAALLNAGDHIIASKNLFASSNKIISDILPKWAISHTYLTAANFEQLESHIQPTTRLIYIETPSNPSLDLIDLEFVDNIAKKHKLVLCVDNCFATPYLQLPAKYGAHLVVHSATKYIDGQGRMMGGAILGKKELIAKIGAFIRQTGPALSPFNAWILSKSLETLAIRMERHCENAEKLVSFLENNKDILWVKYPFSKNHPDYKLAKKQMTLGGGLVTFELKRGTKRALKFLDALNMLSISANLGDSRTIVTNPATTTHSKLSPEDRKEAGITDGLIRISVGLENIKDIIGDIEQAIKKSM